MAVGSLSNTNKSLFYVYQYLLLENPILFKFLAPKFLFSQRHLSLDALEVLNISVCMCVGG